MNCYLLMMFAVTHRHVQVSPIKRKKVSLWLAFLCQATSFIHYRAESYVFVILGIKPRASQAASLLESACDSARLHRLHCSDDHCSEACGSVQCLPRVCRPWAASPASQRRKSDQRPDVAMFQPSIPLPSHVSRASCNSLTCSRLHNLTFSSSSPYWDQADR